MTTPTAPPAARHPDRPFPPAVVCEGWVRAVLLARELAIDVDPRRLGNTDVLAVQSLAPHLAASQAVQRFVDYAEAEQELSSIPGDDHSYDASCRRGELAVEAAAALRSLLDGHPFAPSSGTSWVANDPVYAAELVASLRADVADRDHRLAGNRQRIADLEAANLSMEQLMDAWAAAKVPGAPAYTLTPAGVAATGGARVLALPARGAR